MELYAEVRRSVYVEGLSERAAARRFGLARETVRKMLRYSVPPGYRRAQPVRCPKLDGFTGVIDQILGDDQQRPKKHRHTAKRIWERFARGARLHGRLHDRQRLRARQDAGRAGDVRAARASAGRRPGRFRRSTGGHRGRRVQGALPGRGSPAQRRRVREGVSRRDDGGVLRTGTTPRSATSTGCRGASSTTTPRWQWRGFSGDGTRQRTRVFSELQSHYLFDARFGRPGKGNDKGKVEGLVGYARRTFFVPVPRFPSWEALNADVARQCRARRGHRLRRHTETIGERFARDRDALLPLPPVPYDACDRRATRVTSLSLVRYRLNDYSVPNRVRPPRGSGERLRGRRRDRVRP